MRALCSLIVKKYKSGRCTLARDQLTYMKRPVDEAECQRTPIVSSRLCDRRHGVRSPPTKTPLLHDKG